MKGVSKEKLLLIGLPVFGLLVGLLGYVALVSPQKSKANELAAQIDAVQAGLVAPSRQKPPKPTPVQATDIFRLTKAMPDSADMPGIILHLARVARASSVTIESVRPLTVVPLTQGYGALPVNVVVVGKFVDVSKFLGRLRQAVSVDQKGGLHVDGRLLVPNQVQMTSTDGRTVSVTLSLDAFVYGAAAPAPPPTTTDTTATATTPSAPGSAG